MKDPVGQLNANVIKESIKVFGNVPNTYETLIDLTTDHPSYIYTHLIFVNSLDENIVIKIGDNEITIQALKDMWFDGLKYNSVIEYKYTGDAPTEGSIQIICY